MFSMGSESSKRMIEALKKHFDEVDHYDIRQVEMHIGKGKPVLMYEGKVITKSYDCIYAKSSFRYALIQQGIAIFFKGKAYMPIHAPAYNIVNDKLLTHLALEQAAIPTPETYITPTVEAAKKLLSTLNFPIILKIPGGTHGKGVMFAESVATASGILDTLSELKQAVIIQEYVETGGSDIRAMVIGDRVVAAIQRKAVKDEKRANIHLGGSAEVIELDAHTKRVAVNTAKAIGAEICAVDILESVKGPLILEANLSPGLQGIMKATGRDIALDIATFLAKRTKESKAPKEDAHAEKIVEASSNAEQQIIGKLDYRGERILVSEFASKMSGFKEDQDVLIKVSKNKILIEKA